MTTLPPLPVELDWSNWTPLLPTEDLANLIPNEPGISRIAHSKVSGIHYVGHSDEDLSRRVRSLGYEMKNDDEMPFRDPHTAAPCLWAMKKVCGGKFFVSWDTEIPSEELEFVKAAYLFRYRTTLGQSPTANFGNMISGYTQSSVRDSGIRGGKSSTDERPNVINVPLLSGSDWDDVTGDDWMGLDWTGPVQYTSEKLGGLSYSFPQTSGIFRIWREGVDHLDAVGTTVNIGDRIPKLVDSKNDVVVSFSGWDFGSRSEKKQIESDLKGAHYLARSSDFQVLEDDESEYKTIIQNGETKEVEFKGRFPNHAKKVVHDIFAIANTNGGKLFMGVTDSQEVKGTNIQQSRERISDLVGGNTSHPISLNQDAVEIDGNDVLIVEIPQATEMPYSIDGIYYYRNGPQSERMDSLQMAEWFEEKQK